MIQADERSGFGHAIALHYGKTQTLEEKFGVAAQGCASGNESPETQTKKTMDAAKAPGAAEEGLGFHGGVIFVEPTAPAARINFAFECGTQEIEHAGDGDEQCGALAFDGAQNFAGIGGVFENDGGAEKRRNEKRHELSKDVAERNQRDEAERVKEAF